MYQGSDTDLIGVSGCMTLNSKKYFRLEDLSGANNEDQMARISLLGAHIRELYYTSSG